MNGPDIVFLGPSLTREEARSLAPGALILPPAAAGDVMSTLIHHQPHAIALIDGAFLHNLATYHKELIDALGQGVWVIGASSMGALRAWECEPYGMIGVGEVYQAYANGEFEDDDEVALLHLSEEFDFRPVAEAMVNIRATMAAAVVAGVLTEQEAHVLVARQKQRWFGERRQLESVGDARDLLGLPPERLAALEAFLRQHWVDVKANDAREALKRLQELPEGPMPMDLRPELIASGPYGVLVERDTTVGGSEGFNVTRDQVWRYFVLTDARAHDIGPLRILRGAVADLMRAEGVVLTDEDLSNARLAIATDMGIDVADLEQRARELDIRQDALREWIQEEAFVSRALEWQLYQRMSMGTLDRCLQILIRMGEYEGVRRLAGTFEGLARDSGHLTGVSMGLLTAIMVHKSITELDLPTEAAEIDEFCAYVGLGSRGEFYERLITFIAGHRELFGLPPITLVPPSEEIDYVSAPQSSRGR